MFKSIFSSGIRSAYAVSDHPTFNSEPWSIYPAKKNSNGRIVSVFIFDKKKFESQIHSLLSNSHSNSKNPKVIIQECYELIKFEISQSAKLKHPQILTIIEPLEETKLKFLFVLEPVQNNLKTVQLNKLDQLTIQKGLLQISKSLQFLHNFCHIIHFNLQPLSVYINDQGDWKLFGFRFLHNLNELSPEERDNFYIMNNSSPIPFTNLNLNFTAPELLLDSSNKLSLANDIWSLGCLIYYLYNQGEYIIECFDSDSISDFKTAYKKFEHRFRNNGGAESRHLYKDIPPKLYGLFSQIIARNPHDRLTIDQFIDSDFFNGSIIKAMWFVDEFATKSVDEKLIFMKGMLEVDPESPPDQQTDILSQFPTSFRNLKFLPLMIEIILNELKVLDSNKKTEDVNAETMISLALNITLRIGKSLSNLTFQDKVYNILLKNNQSFWKKAAQAASSVTASSSSSSSSSSTSASPFVLLISCSTKVLLTLVENMSILRSKLNDKQLLEFLKLISEQILIIDAQPSVEQIKVQELFLKELSSYLLLFEFPYIKNNLFPLICQIFKTTTILSTKLTTISTFEKFVDDKIIDKLIVTEQLLPLLNNLKSRDKLIVEYILRLNSKIIASDHINLEIETMVGQILPQCWQLTFGCNNCTASEFKKFIATVGSIETNLVERRIKQLPERNMNEGGFDSTPKGSNDFNNLINTQKFNQGNQDQILKAPKDEVTIQPRKISNNSNSNSNSVPTTPTPSGPQSSDMKPQPRTTSQLNPRRQDQKGLPHTPPVLSFGATSAKKNVDNDALLRTLNTSYPVVKPSTPSIVPAQQKNLVDDDDDFNDFQTTSATTPSNPAGSSGRIDWNVELNKTKPMNQLSLSTPKVEATVFTIPKPYTPDSYMNTPMTPTSQKKYPPGFDSNIVLMPTSKH